MNHTLFQVLRDVGFTPEEVVQIWKVFAQHSPELYRAMVLAAKDGKFMSDTLLGRAVLHRAFQ